MVARSWNERRVDEVCWRILSGLRSCAASATYLLAYALIQPLAVASLKVCAITESGSRWWQEDCYGRPGYSEPARV
jgi:hypothetical protein